MCLCVVCLYIYVYIRVCCACFCLFVCLFYFGNAHKASFHLSGISWISAYHLLSNLYQSSLWTLRSKVFSHLLRKTLETSRSELQTFADGACNWYMRMAFVINTTVTIVPALTAAVKIWNSFNFLKLEFFLQLWMFVFCLSRNLASWSLPPDPRSARMPANQNSEIWPTADPTS